MQSNQFAFPRYYLRETAVFDFYTHFFSWPIRRRLIVKLVGCCGLKGSLFIPCVWGGGVGCDGDGAGWMGWGRGGEGGKERGGG